MGRGTRGPFMGSAPRFSSSCESSRSSPAASWARFGEANVFTDLDGVEPGADFVEEIIVVARRPRDR